MPSTPMPTPPFDWTAPTPEQTVAMANLRDRFIALHEAVEELVPRGRYRSLAITAIEEAALWANKGVTHP